MKLKQLTERQTREWIEVYTKIPQVTNFVSTNILDDILAKKEEQYHQERTKTWFRRNFHENCMKRGIKETNDYLYATLGKEIVYSCLSVLNDYDIMFNATEVDIIQSTYAGTRILDEVKTKLVIMNEYASKPFTVTEDEVKRFLEIKNILSKLEEMQRNYYVLELKKGTL